MLTDPYHLKVWFIVKARLKKMIKRTRHNGKTFSTMLSCLSVNLLTVTLWFGFPNPQWKKEKMKFVVSFVLFLKALGYFLLPSSFFPEQEFITPHGFLVGEIGEKSKELAAGLASCLNPASERGQLLHPPSPTVTGSMLMCSENIFLKRKGKKNARE
jgi:uncharacterized membrane protein YkvA (DUF1232 family)